MQSYWISIFKAEIIICLVTSAYWLFFPDHYLNSLFGESKISDREFARIAQLLLRTSSIFLLTIYGWFYYKLLAMYDPRSELFKYILISLQEGAAIGDVIIIVLNYNLYPQGMCIQLKCTKRQ